MVAIYNREVGSSTATFDTEPRSAAEERRRIQDDANAAVVAEIDGVVVAWASLSPWSQRRAYARTAETSVYVDESARGRGVGRRILREVLRLARSRRLHTVLARISEESIASLRLHESLGFRRIGVMHEVGFKFGRWLDVHLLERAISDGRRINRTAASPRRRRTPPPRRTGPRGGGRAR